MTINCCVGLPKLLNLRACMHRRDDILRTQLRALLTELRPEELVVPANGLESATRAVMRAALGQPRTNEMVPRNEFWDGQQTLAELHNARYFGAKGGLLDAPGNTADADGQWPELLQVRL